MKSAISEATTQRLSLLLRGLKALEAEGLTTASSAILAERFSLNSAQIRKDLAHFGEFGVRGVGYRVADLRSKLQALMGLSTPRTVVIVGAGNLGLALADSRNFNNESFKVAALFDVDGRKIGSRSKTGVPIRAVSELPQALTAMGATIGALAVPPDAVREMALTLAAGGVKGLLNFAAAPLAPIPGVVVKNVDMALFLEGLSFQLASSA